MGCSFEKQNNVTIVNAFPGILDNSEKKKICDCNCTQSHNHLVCKRTLNHLAKLAKWLSCVVSTYPYDAFDCIFLSCHKLVSESICTLQLFNVKKLFAQNRCDIWNLSDCNGTQTHNHIFSKRTLNRLAKLAKWLICVVSTYLYGAFNCMFLSCDIRVHTVKCTVQISTHNTAQSFSQFD